MKVNVRSIFDVIYTVAEFNALFLINNTTNDRFPASINKFRKQ